MLVIMDEGVLLLEAMEVVVVCLGFEDVVVVIEFSRVVLRVVEVEYIVTVDD